MKVYVNEDCIGCGLCANMCPEVFSMDSGVSQAVGSADGYESAVSDAAEACPVNAIELE